MKTLKFISFFSFLTIHFCYGQTFDNNSADLTIIKTISSLTGRFVIQKPLKNDNSLYFDTMDVKEMFTNKQFADLQIKHPFLKSGDCKMDKSTIDTTFWTEEVFPNKILIPDFNVELNYKDLIVKYHLQADQKLSDTVWNYNNDNCFKRKIITQISKPIFNSKKTVCVIETKDNDICEEGFRQTTYLFYKINGEWLQFEFAFGRQAKY